MKKKIISFALGIALLISSLSATTVYAAGEIEVVDSTSYTVQTFPVETTDITEPLRLALDYCSLNASEYNILTIKIPAGVYCITETNIASSNTVLDLTEGATILNDCPRRGNIINSPSGYYGYDGLKNFTVRGGELGYTDENANESTLSRIAHANGVRFENVKFTNGFISHFVEVAGSTNVVFDGCVFDGFIGDLSSSSCEAIQIDILEEYEHFSGFPYYDATMNSNITVQNCTFANIVSGVGTKSLFHGYYQNNITIKNNTFTNLTGTAIYCSGYTNCDISGNTITNCAQGINYFMMKSDSRLGSVCDIDNNGTINSNCGTKIYNNTISVNATDEISTASAIYVFGNNVTASKQNKYDSYAKVGNYSVNNIQIFNNTINTTAHGIRVYDTVNSKIYNNTVTSSKRSGGYGIYAANSSNSNQIYSNTISKFTNGILIASSSKSNKVTKNTVTDAGSSGIVINSGCDSNIVDSNAITNSGKNGVLIGASKTSSVQSNKISSSGADAIHVNSKANVNTIKGNTFNVHGKYAIYCDKGSTANVYVNNYKNSSGRYGYSKGDKKDYKFANLAVPTVTVSKKGTTATVSWKKVGGANDYYVYRSTSKNGTYSYIGHTKSTKFQNKKLKKGKTYYYKVSAVKVANGIKQRSNLSTVKGKKI
ncbi:right-handed parallel beta-helix repeat-containing protein [Eubacterium sp.]|uniref:right-handed parallel beta-helix repeat-containing protein n=1 Tax=Eubacterium sp. TaxID=142586 RepID=UPI003F027546